MFQNLIFKGIIYLSLGYIISAAAILNPSDQDKPLTIEADTAEFDRSSGVSLYQGHVKIYQGSTYVSGDKLMTKQDKTHNLEEIIIHGTLEEPAHYEASLDAHKPKLIASAQTIKVYPQKRYVILLNHAKISQGENAIHGEHIEYDMEKQKMRATATINDQGEKNRTTIIILPELK